ncbi:MAG: DUF1697 domain-containing protein [Acidimicrobiia bacterium]
MSSVALLRGINVGGKNKVEMGRLRAVFEQLGLDDVRSCINTGNVIFTAGTNTDRDLVSSLERVIAAEFGLDLKVLLRGLDSMLELAGTLPDDWTNDSETKSDVMFLWDDADDPSVLDRLTIREGVDEVIYTPGAVLWRVDRAHYSRSGMNKLVGTKLYKSMTVRNCNTVRKLVELMRPQT